MASIDPDRALALVLEHTPAGTVRDALLEHACGLVLAEDIASDRDYPPFPRAMMDGYAVRVADAGGLPSVRGVVSAGQDPEAIEVQCGQAVEIMTGAPCPPGCEAVVTYEESSREGGAVRLPPVIRAGQHIARQGSDCAAGTRVLEAGQTLTALGVAALASFGRSSVRVLAPPSLAIVVTGNEIVGKGGPAGRFEMRDANGAMLAAQARTLGVSALLDHAHDSVEAIRQALDRACEADIVILCGGVSAGRYDLVPAALAGLGTEVVFRGVAQKPGKPLMFARKGRQLFFCLPGNPLGSHLCFHRYVAASVRKQMGLASLDLGGTARLATEVEVLPERTLFQPACVELDQGMALGSPRWKATPSRTSSSADVFSAVAANAYLRLPPGKDRVSAGAEVAFEWIGGAR